MYQQIPKVLLDPSSENNGGGNQDIPAHVPIPGLQQNIQAEANKGSAAQPIQQTQVIPENIKSMKFDIEGEDIKGDIEEVSKEFNVEKKVIKKEEPNKEEVKKGLEAKFPEKKKEESPLATKEQLESLVTEKGQKLPARDFSIFPEEYKKILNEMSRPAFETFTKVFKEHQELKTTKDKLEAETKNLKEGGLPTSWYEHPEAWRLHPASQQSLVRLDKLEAEEQFWREQLENINNGQQYRLLKGWNSQTGELVAGDPVEPSEQAKTDIFLRLGRYQSEKQNEAVRLNNFAQNFGKQMQAFNAQAENIINSQWPWHKDEKHEGQKYVKEFINEIPIQMREQLGFRVASLLYASLQETRNMLEEEKSKQKTGEIVKESNRLAEPSLRSPSLSGDSNKKMAANGSFVPPRTFDLEGM